MQQRSFLSRRSFLKIGGASLSLAALGPSLTLGAESAKRPWKKGFMMNAFPGGKKSLSVLEQYKLLKEAGFDGAEPSSPLDANEVMAACKETGLVIPSICVGQGTRQMSSKDPAERKEGTKNLERALRDAKACGAKSVLTVAGIVDASISYEDAWNRTRDAIKPAVPLAEELGVKIAIENVWNNFLLSPIEAALFVDQFNSPAVGWHFDVGNVMKIGWAEHWIRALGKRISMVHVKEYSRKKMNEQGASKGFAVEYLEGDNDWPSVMKALDDIKYSGWIIAEPAFRPKDVDSLERLKEISKRMDRMLAC